MASPGLVPTPRTTAQRLPARGSHDRAAIEAILDEALVCHLGFVHEGQPFVIPTIHARVGETLYVHGSAASRMLRALEGGVPACVTVTLVDGLVMARSAFHHSMNYRSVVLLGTLRAVDDADRKLEALRAITEHVAPGRYAQVRPPNAKELLGTRVLELPIVEGSAKVRSGPPGDDPEDLALDCWAGVVPLALRAGAPIPAPDLRPGIGLPRELVDYSR
ncbi:MAG: pyridoxamine 5'-phosphate oxidase family protein [Vicinamibacteria bacterium]|nr:pyridoxamine 5'-phosphate oxidase family protein [Vicinamibacteria bacterium]